VTGPHSPGGSVAVAPDLVLSRIGLGTLELAGPNAFGPPGDRDAAVAVLRAAVDAGVTHLDTAGFYGPDVVNDLIREALAPYPDGLHIATKVGLRRSANGGFRPGLTREAIVEAVEQDLRHLGLEVLDLVHLRVGGPAAPTAGSIEAPFAVLAELQQQGRIRHLGVSNVTAEQLAEARSIAPVVAVQNTHSLLRRADDALIDACAADGTAYIAYSPLAGTLRPPQALDEIAQALGASPAQLALAWLLHRSPTVLVIPGTTSVQHLADDLAAGRLVLPPSAVTELDALA
jgi:aryl-alcohol dehydrogenase-like predicted oxidoreductase